MPFIPTAAALVERLPRTLRRHRLMKTWMRLTGEPPLQLVHIRDGSYGYADMSDGFLRLIPIEGDYERDFFTIGDALLGDGGVFLDAGANHGLLSFGLAGRHGAKIDFHLFEPNPKLLASIEKTKALYPAMRMALNGVAIADKPGTVSFEIDPGQTGRSHITEDAAQGVEVPAITLDAYIADRGISAVELLKIDVEGYELPALRGARRALKQRTIKAVYFEYFEKYLARVGPPSELIDYLGGLGFVVCFCRPCDINPRGVATHTFRGLQLLPIAGLALPPMTDLMAVPKEWLTAL